MQRRAIGAAFGALVAFFLEDLVSRVRDVQGVRDVESLLHLPGQRAPMHH